MIRNISRNLWHVNFKKVNMFYSNFDCQFQHQVLTSYFTWIKKFTFFLCNFFQHMQLLSYFNKFSEYIETYSIPVVFCYSWKMAKQKMMINRIKKDMVDQKFIKQFPENNILKSSNTNIFYENSLLIFNSLSRFKFNLALI